MSEPKRYHLWAGLECHAFSKAEAVMKFSEEEDGMWVKYGDYARLKAEVERLRKAGDAMAFNYESMSNAVSVYDCDLMKYVDRWNAAKEGKPSV